MGWIVGIKKGFGELVFDECIKGVTRSVPFEETVLNDGMTLPGKRRSTGLFELQLSDLQPCQDMAPLKDAGLPAGVLDSQAVYEYIFDGRKLYIPAQLVIGSLYCTSHQLRRYAMTPLGPNMFTQLQDDGRAAVEVKVSDWPSGRNPFNEFHRDLLLWLTCYPSSKRMTGSLVANALKGKLAMTLPLAKARISVKGPINEGILVADTMFIDWLRPLEPPLRDLEGRVPDLVQFMRHTAPKVSPSHKACAAFGETLTSLGNWKLTDDEWARLYVAYEAARQFNPELPRVSKVDDMRYRIESILRKHHEGLSWLEVGGTRQAASRLTMARRNLVVSGAWDTFMRCLSQIRAEGELEAEAAS